MNKCDLKLNDALKMISRHDWINKFEAICSSEWNIERKYEDDTYGGTYFSSFTMTENTQGTVLFTE